MATYTFLVPEKDLGLSGVGGNQPGSPGDPAPTQDKPKAVEVERSGAEIGPYETAIAHFVKNGGNDKDGRRILDSEMAGDFDPKHLPSALVYHGFAKPSAAEELATAIMAEENQKMLDKEDRKASEYQVGMQAEEAVGKGEPRAAEKLPESPDADQPERAARPRLRQTTRKAAAMER